jgi:DNA-binding LacI/PurR family transcriptional regulator
MEKVQRALMADVARDAGVSVMTVSRVLSGYPGVSDETRARVERSVAALDYRANAAARVLAGGRSRTLGVIALESDQFGPTHMLFGIEAAARAANHSLTFATLRQPDSGELQSTLRHLRDQRVEGVVVIAPLRGIDDALTEIEHELPVVLVGGDPTSAASTVMIDQFRGGRLATEHLLGLGHTTVHHVAGPPHWIDAAERHRGWEQALVNQGCRVEPALVGDWSAASGYDAGKILGRDPTVTAIFTANDQTAMGLLLALHEQGRSVPDDVSVVGFDDTPESGFYLPPLTTVRQNFGEVGERCVRLLLSQIVADAHRSTHVSIEPTLVVRASSVRSRP